VCRKRLEDLVGSNARPPWVAVVCCKERVGRTRTSADCGDRDGDRGRSGKRSSAIRCLLGTDLTAKGSEGRGKGKGCSSGGPSSERTSEVITAREKLSAASHAHLEIRECLRVRASR
jgi:hypothetical protein